MDFAALVLCLRDWRDCLFDGVPDLCAKELECARRPHEVAYVWSKPRLRDLSGFRVNGSGYGGATVGSQRDAGTGASAAITASVNSSVPAVPPTSRVTFLPSR